MSESEEKKSAEVKGGWSEGYHLSLTVTISNQGEGGESRQ